MVITVASKYPSLNSLKYKVSMCVHPYTAYNKGVKTQPVVNNPKLRESHTLEGILPLLSSVFNIGFLDDPETVYDVTQNIQQRHFTIFTMYKNPRNF